MTDKAIIYTDGSCHTQLRIGGWAALVFVAETKIILSGSDADTTHNRMELLAVIEAIKYVKLNIPNAKRVHICSDSQYVVGLDYRKSKLSGNNFITKKGNELQNADLMQALWQLVEGLSITYEKVKAHEKATHIPNHNIEVDKLSRKIVRDAVSASLL